MKRKSNYVLNQIVIIMCIMALAYSSRTMKKLEEIIAEKDLTIELQKGIYEDLRDKYQQVYETLRYYEIEDDKAREELQRYLELDANISAYCSCERCTGKTSSNKWYGITASGREAQSKRTIAMSKEYDFGTEVEIDGELYIVEDRGGYIQGNRIDIYFDTHEEVMEFGRQFKQVKVYY